MSRYQRVIAAAVGVLVATAVGSAYAADKMTVVSWGGDFQKAEDQAFFTPFAKATGVQVNQETWEGELAKIRAMVEAKNVSWDVVVADFGHAITGCDEGFLEKIDKSRLGDLNDFVPGALHDCGVSTDVFALIFAYDGNRLKDGPKTIADVFDTKKFPGKRGFRKQPKYVLEQALMADGVPAAKVYEVLGTPQGVDRAFAKLDSIKKDIIWWSTNSQPAQLLADGEVVISEVFNGRIYDAVVNGGKNFVPVWEGQVYSFNTWIIPKGANKDLAQKMIEFAVQPEHLGQFSNLVPYAPARKSALQYVSDKMKPFLPTAPQNFTNALGSNEEWWADHDEAMRERFSKWIGQ